MKNTVFRQPWEREHQPVALPLATTNQQVRDTAQSLS